MSSTDVSNTRTEGDGQSAPQHHIPPLVPVTHDARELWEDYRNAIEAKAQKCFPIPATFLMVPLKMSILDIEGTKTYFFKARVPNNKFVNVRIRLSGKAESRDNQVAVESRASGGLDEEITKIF
ncbi:unnamed protein product [Adineta steineri]|uniref:Uncharacterized protein n=2 Tax=Adineta steineri TaxID=433720 RepID=A0A814BG15_9BILA|nr:unnamed protein product [Adineta steineri]CAF0929522.1 unnamed protein product [Adineta steineri]CAF1513385.1 unnamed protein product [Adineta steineri]CAF1513413.1 unnamed protein product [Adineta steineri]CAF1514813.1 unnamed protein product [Adineta steineri]